MKSVSFSDLRNSTDMLNRSDQIVNFGDSIIKRSSSYKNLTNYLSSEDILKRFSSKTPDLKYSRDGYRSDDTHGVPNTKPQDILLNAQHNERTLEKDKTNAESTIQELRTVTLEHEKTISSLQLENVILQNELAKNLEELKFQENRIKYLEHMLTAFNSNLQDNKNIFPQVDETEETIDNLYEPSYDHHRERNILCGDFGDENNKVSYTILPKNNNKLFTDLNKRPNSADSTLQNEYKYGNGTLEKNKREKYKPSSLRTYTSDSDERNYINIPANNVERYQKTTSSDYILGQRSISDKSKSSNLTNIKVRLDEFSKYAKRSTEQNSLNQFSSTLPLRDEVKHSNKYGMETENNFDPTFKLRPRVINQSSNSRPPIDPYYNQRRGMQNEGRITEDRPGYSSLNKIQDFSEEEDEQLKERVQKILDKHKYPSTQYRSEDNMKPLEYSYKSNSNFNNYGPTDGINTRKYEAVPVNARYIYQSNEIVNDNESNILRSNSSTNDLIAKYLNYQGSTDVS